MVADQERLDQWDTWLASDDSSLADELASVIASCDTLEQAAAVLRVPVEWLRRWVPCT